MDRGHRPRSTVQKSGLLFGCRTGDILMSSINPLDRPSGKYVKPLDITFMVANAVGAALYLWLASLGWRIPQEHGMVPVTGEPFIWAASLPVLGVFLLANIVWGGLLLRNRDARRGVWWFVIGGLWLIAICVDFAHH